MTYPDTLTPPPPDGQARVCPALHDTDVLGLRIVAALIDLAFVSVMIVGNGLTTAQHSMNRGEIVTRVDLQIFLGSMLLTMFSLYYFVGEAIFGRTIGKQVLGLRVMRTGGGRPSGGRIAVRTALRAVDWLPFAYLVGFVVMLATGKRRQRLGDLAADTVVVRMAPVRSGGALVVLLVLVLATGVVLSRVAARAALGDASTKYQANGVTLQYPAEWRDATDDIGRAGPEDELWFIALHATETDGVGIAALPAGGTPVRADDLDAVRT